MTNSKELRTWRRVQLTLVREKAEQPYAAKGPEASAALIRRVIGSDPRELVVALYLDTSLKTIAVHIVSIGTLSTSLVHPREVFGPAVMLAAASLILAHNHPAGDPKPSQEDMQVTERMDQAGKLLGIPLLDHLVIGETTFYSFAEGATRPLPP